MTDEKIVHLCITYHMEHDAEVAETCVTLPMRASVAADILRNVREPILTFRPSPKERIYVILEELAALQGYRFTGTVSYEQDKRWLELGEEEIR